MRETFDFSAHERRILAVLLGWGVGSMVTGWILSRDQRPFTKAVGQQFVGWGLVDALLAVNGLRGNARTRAKERNGQLNSADMVKKARLLERIFWFNAGLNVLYLLGGRRLTEGETPQKRGMGWGVILQAAFLFFFDPINALLLRYHLSGQPTRPRE